MSNEYQGWTNRETWAAHLHITNDAGLVDYFATVMADARIPVPGHMTNCIVTVAIAVRDWLESQQELLIEGQCHRDTAMMLTDIGSLWRVNWDEVAKALTEYEI